MAPEYLVRGQLTDKADVYSFGVLVLEIVCGRRNYVFREDSGSLLQTVRLIKLKTGLLIFGSNMFSVHLNRVKYVFGHSILKCLILIFCFLKHVTYSLSQWGLCVTYFAKMRDQNKIFYN